MYQARLSSYYKNLNIKNLGMYISLSKIFISEALKFYEDPKKFFNLLDIKRNV